MATALFQKIWQKYFWNTEASTRASFSQDTEWFLKALKGGTGAGANVSYNSVTGLAAAYRCIDVLAKMPAKLPLHIYRKTAEGNKVKVENDPRATILHTTPNQYQTPFNLLSIAEANRQTMGNALLGIVRNGQGIPQSLELLPNKHTEIKRLNGNTFYHQKRNIFNEAVDVVWRHENVLNVPNFSTNGILGKSTIEHHKSTLGLAIATQNSAEKFFENGANFEGYLEIPQGYGAVNDDAKQNLKRSWRDEYGGAPNHHKTPVLEGGVKFVQTSMPLKDAQFLESRKYSSLQVCQIFGVPPQKIYDLEDAHYNNVDSLNIEFYLDTVLAQLTAWEQEINKKFFFSFENDLFVKFNVKGLLRGDIMKQAEFYTRMVQNGIMNRNEIRKLEEMNSIPGGDIYTVQMQMMDLQNSISQGKA